MVLDNRQSFGCWIFEAWNPKAVNPFSSNAKVEFNDKIEKLSEPNQLYLVFLEGLSS